jgi:type IV pilus assembly protein PilW
MLMNPKAVTTRASQSGFSVVELMVAMTLSLILIAGVLSLVYSSKVTYLENERVARNQEGGRAAFELILRDVRGAGFAGCAQPIPGVVNTNNLLADPTSLLWSFDAPLQGYEGTNGNWSPALDPILSGANPAPSPNNDIIAIRTVRPGLPQFVTSGITNPDDDIVVTKIATQGIQGSTFVINDCGGQTFFAAQVADNGATATLTRNTGGAEPTNQSTSLGTTFMDGAQVSPVDTVIYYIAPSATPPAAGNQAGPALWKIVSGSNGGAPQEYIPNVENMEVQYGVDTDGDAVVNEYDDANTVNDANNWNNVISVRIAILVRSPEANAPRPDVKKYTLLTKVAGPFNDRYERSVFTTTVTLRNRTT